jgi:CRP-like cAMP-binding protein
MSLLTGERRSATVVATTSLTVLTVGPQAIKRVLQEDKSLVEQISAIVAKRQSVTQTIVDSLSREQAALALTKQQQSLVERIQNYFWGPVEQ